MDDDDDREVAAPTADADDALVVQHCPWCGEHMGSFWGRREADGAHWCEACQRFFRVVQM